MNKMVKLLALGAALVLSDTHVRAMNQLTQDEMDILANNNTGKTDNVILGSDKDNERFEDALELQKLEAKKAADRKRALIKYAVVACAGAALAADFYFNNGEVTNKYIIQPTQKYVIEPGKALAQSGFQSGKELVKSGWNYLSSLTKNPVVTNVQKSVSNAVETAAPQSSWYSSLWNKASSTASSVLNKVPSVNTVVNTGKNAAGFVWNKIPAMPTWLSNLASKSVEVATEETAQTAQKIAEESVKTALSTLVL